MNRHGARILAAALLVAGLGGCGGFEEGSVFARSFWSDNVFQGRSIDTELGLAAMAKGDYSLAEGYFAKALKRNPRDVRALLGLGIIYQKTGQTTKAREMYEAIIAIRPDRSERMVVWSNFEARPVSEIASVNLALMASGGVTRGMEHGAAGTDTPFTRAASQGRAAAPAGVPTSPAMFGRMARGAPSPGSTSAAVPMFSDAESNIDSRFNTLVTLRDQGLITQEEFDARRQANIGALLPLTAPPPAAGLDRPVPSGEQISGRLRAIGRALELRALTIGQHTAERSMILDALMPAAPVVVANPGVPPQGLMEAADAVRRLEQLNAAGLITTDEYARERSAIERAMQPEPAVAAAPTPAPASEAAASTGPQPAVHLASYRSRKDADRGWAQLRRAHRSLLGQFRHEITKVNLGRKGTYYRLKVGPVESAAAASDLCRKLKKRRQFCEASSMGG